MTLSIIMIIHALLILFISGILYGFSDFIMRALNKLPAQNAISTMNHINVSVYKSVFMVLFMLLVPVSIAIAIFSIVTIGWSDSITVIVATGLYVFGMFMVTGMGNVPLNEELKNHSLNGNHDSSTTWHHYYVTWTKLNSLRCVLGAASSVGFIIAALKL